MTEAVSNALTKELVEYLQGEKLVLLSTVDLDGGPHVQAVSWLVATSREEIRLALDPRSRASDNIRRNNTVALAVLGLGSCFVIRGTAAVDTENLPGVSLKMVQVTIRVHEVRDAMFYGARLTVEPAYKKTYDPKLVEKYDQQVYAALRS
jgi:predicted pyridoxine 5'-phosphate oxidase superfamily flavin-nucleotide-binding protein